MSPWWREEITIELSPAEAVLVRRSRGLRRRELNRQTLTASAFGTTVWNNIVAALSAGLESSGWRNATLRVTLRGALVRYLILPRVEKLNERDALIYAQQSFADIYGETASTWAICLDAAAQGRRRIAAAADLELIEALRSQARTSGLHLTSVQPALSAAVDDLACVDREFSGWLALIDGGHSCLARLDRGKCLSVRTARYAESAEQHLLTQLQQDALCTGLEPATRKLYIHSVLPLDHARLQTQGWLASPLPAGSGR